MRVLKFLLKRLGSIVVSIACVVAITFAMMRVVPSDYFTQLELRYGANTAGKQMLDLQRQEYREIFHLDDPLWKQVGRYFVRVMKWDFGPSYKEPGEAHKITELVNAKLPVTLTVACAGMGIALVFGIPLGIFAALRRNSWIDYTLTSVSMVGQVVPPYVLAVLLTLFFAVFVRNFQIGDSFPLEWLALPSEGWGSWKNVVMPALARGAAPTAAVARYIRSSVLETLEQDFVRTAVSKGLGRLQVVVRHALRPSLVPVVTVMGPQLSYMIVGSVLVEDIFRLQGLGSLFVNAVNERDVPLVITSTFILAAAVMLINLVVDILYSVIDPRIELK